MAAPDISASFGKAITPADGADLPNGKCWAIWVGVAGDVALTGDPSGANPVTYKAIAGLLPVNALRVLATGTTATNLVALYG